MMKRMRIRSLVVCILFAIFVPMNASAAIKIEASVGDANYFILNQNEQGSLTELISTILTTPYSLDGQASGAPSASWSLYERWINVGKQLMEVQWDTPNGKTFPFAEIYGFCSRDKLLNGYGITGSVADAVTALNAGMVTSVEALKQTGKSVYLITPLKADLDLAKQTQAKPAFYGFSIAPSSENKKDDYYYSIGCAVILTDFKVQPILIGNIMEETAQVDQREGNKTDSAHVNGVTNYTKDTVATQQSVAHTLTEAVTNTVTRSSSYTVTEGIKINTDVPLAKIILGSDVNIEGSMTWQQAWTDTVAASQTQSVQTSNTSAVSLSLPPHTKVVVEQQTNDVGATVKYNYPVTLTYTAHIIFLRSDGAASQHIATYEANALRNSAHAAEDLFKRATVSAITDPDGLAYKVNDSTHLTNLSPVGSARNMVSYIPLTMQGAELLYSQKSTASSVHAISPLYDLERVSAASEGVGYTVPIGDKLILNTIGIQGFNGNGAPYYGFDARKGNWTLLDDKGDPVQNNANAVAQVAVNPITKVASLNALGAGRVYLRYDIHENVYPKVANSAQFIKNSDLDERAVIQIDVAGALPNIKLNASGSVVGRVGDVIDLSSYPGIAVHAEDAQGVKLLMPISWEAMESEAQGIKVEDGHKLTFTKAGSFHIRACANNTLYSPWLTVDVKDALMLSRLVIADNPAKPQLLDCAPNSGTIDLTQLIVSGEDQYAEPFAPGAVAWYVNGVAAPTGKLTPTASGAYKIHAQATAGNKTVKSNELTLTVVASGAGEFVLNETSLQLGAGDRFTLVATPLKPGSDAYTYASSKPSVASVDASGTVAANAKGEATITARNSGGIEKTCRITVVAAPSGLAFNPAQLLMGVGDNVKLSPVLSPAGSAARVSYKSSDTGVASIDANGVVRAIAKGDVTITGTTHNGLSGECAIRVADDPINLTVPGRNPDAVVPEPIAGGVTIEVPVSNVKGELVVTLTARNGRGVDVMSATGQVLSGVARFTLQPGQLPPGQYTLWISSSGNAQNRSLPAVQIGKLVIRYRPTASGTNDLRVLAGSTLPVPIAVSLSGSDPDISTALNLTFGGQTVAASQKGDGTAMFMMPAPEGATGRIALTATAPETVTQHAIAETHVGSVTVLDQAALLGGDLRSKLGAGYLFLEAAPNVPVAVAGEGTSLGASGRFAIVPNGQALRFAMNWPMSGGLTGRLDHARYSPLSNTEKAAQSVPGKLSVSASAKLDPAKGFAEFAFDAQELAWLDPGYYTFSIEAAKNGEFVGFPPLTLATIQVTAASAQVEWTIPSALRASVGQVCQLVKPIPSGGTLPALTVSSSNNKVATITNAGVLTLRKAGRATITVYDATGAQLKCKLTVVPNSFSRKKPLYVKNKAALFSSTKKLYYKKGALNAEVFLYNRTGAKLTGLGACMLELYKDGALIYSHPIQPQTFKTALKNKSFATLKVTLTDAEIPGVSAKSLDLGSKRFQAVIRADDIIPLSADTKGAVTAKSFEAQPAG